MMSNDPATFVAGVPVKISERYRRPRKVTLPAACHHQVNTEIFTQEYDFAVEKATLQYVQDRRKRLEEKEKTRNERIAEYDKKKAERIAKEEEERRKQEEERLKQEEEEKERLRIEREEQEKRKQEEEEEEEKRRLEKEKQEEEEKEEDVAEEKESNEVEEPSHEVVSSDEGNCEPGVGQGSTDNDLKQPQAQVDPQQDTSPASAPVAPVMSNSYGAEATSNPWMLQPTPFPSQKNTVRSPIKTPTNINFADFEGEGNDPFDSAALKSINDMEELAKVLDSSNIGQQNVSRNTGSSVPGKNANNPFLNSQGAYGAYGQYAYYLQQQQQQQQQQIQQQNLPQTRQGFPQYGTPVGTMSQVPTSSPSTVPTYTSNSQYGRDLSRNFQNPYYPQQWNNGYNVNSPSKTAQFVPYDYRLQATNMSNNPNTSQSVVSPVNNQVGASNLQTYPNSASGDPTRTLNKRQDLEEFYSKYYSQNKTGGHQNQSYGGGQSGESTPSHSSSSGAAGSTSGSLRSCRSVPDLTAPEDSEVTKLSSGIQSETRGFSHTPPPRPNSTGLTGLEDWKPLPEIPGLTELPQHPQPPLYTPVKNRLPDPFTELTTDAQALVQNMAEMGFPRPRVARAVQKLGTDHKKLLEVLLVLQSLQENGEDGYKAERAFYHYLGDVQKTRDHIAAAKQLLDLGFEEERIVDALLKHDNDRDKALEELIA